MLNPCDPALAIHSIAAGAVSYSWIVNSVAFSGLAGVHTSAMEFYLYFDEWNAIRNNIPEDSAAHDCLQRAVVMETGDELQPDLRVSCDEDATTVIIQAAKLCCPEALSRIELAFTKN